MGSRPPLTGKKPRLRSGQPARLSLGQDPRAPATGEAAMGRKRKEAPSGRNVPPRPPPSPEAPPAVRGAVGALAHGHHFARAEGLPQEHREGALDVQDGGGPLQGGGERGKPRVSHLPARACCPSGRKDATGQDGQRIGFLAPTQETVTNANTHPGAPQDKQVQQDQC